MDEWKKTSEEIPDDEITVLMIYAKKEKFNIGYFLNGYWWDDYNNPLENPTHWMDLPAPPEMTNE